MKRYVTGKNTILPTPPKIPILKMKEVGLKSINKIEYKLSPHMHDICCFVKTITRLYTGFYLGIQK